MYIIRMIKILFTTIIVLVSFMYYIFFYNKNNIIFYSPNMEFPIKLKLFLQKYLKSLTKNEILFKTDHKYNFLQKNKLLDFYRKNLLQFSQNEKDSLIKHTYFIKKTVKYSKIKNFNWKFIKFSNILEKNMPFTMDEYIFLPEIFLNNLNFNDNYLKMENSDTLIHECIHIIQRKHQDKFDKIYPKIFNCFKISNLIITNKWNKLKMSNPDGLDINWVYKYNNKFYLPLLIFNSYDRKVKQIIITLKFQQGNYITTSNFQNIYNFIPFRKYPKNISLYHPNEIMAYIIPKIILGTQQFNNLSNIHLLINML
jgi:hypothetical protein